MNRAAEGSTVARMEGQAWNCSGALAMPCPRSRRVGLVVLVVAAGVPLAATATPPVGAAGAAAPAWTAYVTSVDDNSVVPISTAGNTPGTPVPVGSGPFGVAITPDGKTAYVSNSNDNTVTPVSIATNTPGTPIPVGTYPFGVAVTPDGATAYVTNAASNTVTPISTATNTPGTPIAVGFAPYAVAVTPDGTTAYVTDQSSGTVTPISTATNTPGTPIPVGTNPAGVAITPDGATAYVVNEGSNTVTPVSIATNTPGTPIPVGSKPAGVAISPDGATAYVANEGSNTVTPVSIATNTTGTPIGAGTGPYDVAVTPDGATAYVGDYLSNTVIPISTAHNTAGPPITMGTNPSAIAITPDQAPVAHLEVTTAPVGGATSFDASASTVAYGTIAIYAWDFGDGSSDITTKSTITHTYMAAGSFTASVTELSSGGTSTSQTFTGQTVSRNGGPQARASSTVTIPESPTITSGDTATFALGTAGSFPVTTTGTPPASLSESGALPPGVTFTGDGNGTASLVYDGTASMVGTYPITITASNGTAPDATQAFTLKLDQPPTITSADSTTFTLGTARTFPVTTTGTPPASLSQSGALPAGVTFTDDGNGTASLAYDGTASTVGTYPITITASNGTAPDTTQGFTLKLASRPTTSSLSPPRVRPPVVTQ